MSGDPLRADLARLVRQLLEEGGGEDDAVARAIREHLGVAVSDLPVHGETLQGFEHANL
jgi:hypothetical protein